MRGGGRGAAQDLVDGVEEEQREEGGAEPDGTAVEPLQLSWGDDEKQQDGE